MSGPLVAIGPEMAGFAAQAVLEGGGRPVGIVAPGPPADRGRRSGEAAGAAPTVPAGGAGTVEGLIWLSAADMDGLAAALEQLPSVRWVQLPFAGVENAVSAGLVDGSRTWTCAKGSYARPVAEHALMLALAGLRVMPTRLRSTSWGRPAGQTLYGARVAVLGGGGIAAELLRLLAPFEAEATVVRRNPDVPTPGAARTVGTSDLLGALEGALVVFVALALTPRTVGIIGAPEMAAMGPGSWLVNVGRGRHVDTDALVDALRSGTIGGAALDVTDPEPLPDGHPLWTLDNCIVTPHTADTWEMVMPPLKERIATNVARFVAGQELVGLVDAEAGY